MMLFECIEKHNPEIMNIFYKKHNLKKSGEGPGGKFKVKRALGTPLHREKALKSIIWHNSKRAGYPPPSQFKLRNNYSPLNISF